jgi:F0F1-type ATP synthase membrane subunit b/b'
MEPLSIATLALCVLLLLLLVFLFFQLRSLRKFLEENHDLLLSRLRNVEERQEILRDEQQRYRLELEKLIIENQKLMQQDMRALSKEISENQAQQTRQLEQTINKGLSDLEATITAPLL